MLEIKINNISEISLQSATYELAATLSFLPYTCLWIPCTVHLHNWFQFDE